MKRYLFIAFGIVLCSLFLNTFAYAQVEVVTAVKNDLVARQIDLSGPCGAFEITKRVAWVLRSQGVGLLSKPGGTNCQGYSIDYLTYQDGAGRDILGDAGGENIPNWGDFSEPVGALLGRWREPFDPGDAATPLPIPGPVVPPVGMEQQILDELRAHEAAEAIERAKAEVFRQSVGREYQKALTFVGKYIAPALIAFFGGKALK